MNVVLQRHCAKYIYAIPDGLRELMSDISREVLRSQPEEIYSFIADYLDALLITRENARVAARLVVSLTQISTTIANLLIRTGMTRREADKVAVIVQTTFKKYLADKTTAIRQQLQQVSDAVEEANVVTEIIDEAGITPSQAEQAALIIQKAYRNFKQRQERETDLLKGMVDWRVAARSTMRLYRKTGVTYEEANRAATLIKAAYKGYYTRRIMKRLLEDSERVSEEQAKSVAEEEPCDVCVCESSDGYGQEESAVSVVTKEEQKVEEVEAEAEAETEPEEVPPGLVEDTETMVLHIVENLLKHVGLGSSSSMPSGVITPPPSEADAQRSKAEMPGESTGALPEAAGEGAASSQASEAPTGVTETPEGTVETLGERTVETPGEETAETPTEVIMLPEPDTGGTDTDDTTATDTEEA